MIGLLGRLARPFLHALDPEDAHRLAIRMLQLAPLPRCAPDDRRLATRAFGLNFENPIGVGAGFDKHGEVPDALLRLGFGFIEVGTVTPLPQLGNPRPRVFRLDADCGVINRLGFNSEGAASVLARLAARSDGGGIVGLNIGANKDAPDRILDYVGLIERFAPVASYVTINVSSPNTPGLRNMQQAAVLDDLLARVIDARERVALRSGPTPVLLKIAPDLSLPELDDVVGIARSRRVDGMIVGNTTITRPPTLHETAIAKEAGGLSGRPLLNSLRGCWPKPMCGSKAFFRWSGSAASIPVKLRLPKSAPVQRSFRSIPVWCSGVLDCWPRSRKRSSPRSTAIRRTILGTTSGLTPHPSRQSRGRNNGRDRDDAPFNRRQCLILYLLRCALRQDALQRAAMHVEPPRGF